LVGALGLGPQLQDLYACIEAFQMPINNSNITSYNHL
jgi:hypothetical protein